jgi:hypothetical protein
MTPGEKNDALRALVSRVVIRRDEITVEALPDFARLLDAAADNQYMQTQARSRRTGVASAAGGAPRRSARAACWSIRAATSSI